MRGNEVDSKDSPTQSLAFHKILEEKDFFPKIFLLPSEIKLDPEHGIKVITRNKNRMDKFQEEHVLNINVDAQSTQKFNQSQNPAGHGLLSLFKRTASRRIKLAICICVYSETKSMLKNTIKGIQQSYEPFLQKAGILPHQIVIVVIFDGIQYVNNSHDQTNNMISFFNEIDIKNGFVKKGSKKTIEDYFQSLNEECLNKEEEFEEGFNIFTANELEDLQSKLFKNQYAEYKRIKSLLQEMKELKKQKSLTVHHLPMEAYKKYEELCVDFCIENNLYYETQDEIQEYLEKKKNIRLKLLYDAVNQTERLCVRYIQSRNDKSLLYPARLKIDDFLKPTMNQFEDEEENLNKKEENYNYMFFAIKHKNQGKLSSHMLFFQGFCKLFDPEYCILADVGMKPTKDAVYRMWEYMELNPKCGGVCGYMNLKIQNAYDDEGYRQDGFEESEVGCLTNFFEKVISIQRAQQFEYHFSHMLDKPFESAFRYIHVLPGAFSAYRWKALKSIRFEQDQPQFINKEVVSQTDRNLSNEELNGKTEEETLMQKYLKTAMINKNEVERLSLEESNMYLAEDRILCLGIHALNYDLEYLPDAESQVDPVTSLTRLMGQRRRWINGSWFAFNYVRNHTEERTTCIFLVQILYYIIVQALAWIGPALFYVAMNLTLVASVREYIVPIFLQFFQITNNYELHQYRIWIFNVKNIVESIPDIFNFVFLLFLFSVVLHSLLINHNNKSFKKIYYKASTLFGVYGIVVIFLLVYNTYEIIFHFQAQDQQDKKYLIPVTFLRSIIIFIILGHALPIFLSFSPSKYIQCITSLVSYIYYVPTYLNILQVFAFCRIDDMSWGTKGLDSNQQLETAREWEKRKYIFVLQYVSINIIIAYAIICLSDYDYPRNVIIFASTCLVALLLACRLLGAVIYLTKYLFKKLFCNKLEKGFAKRNRQNGEAILENLKNIEIKIKEIEKRNVCANKQEEFKKIEAITDYFFDRNVTLNNFGNKLRSRVTKNIFKDSVVIQNKEIEQSKVRMAKKKKLKLRRKVKVIEEVSDNEDYQSSKRESGNNYSLANPEQSNLGNRKAKIKALKQKQKDTKF